MTTYEAVIGLEVHAQLLTHTKLFCGCATSFGSPPNTHVCPVCLGLPGALPVLNQKAVDLAIRTALALGLTVHETSVFSRKNYLYPDLPKGYQISQYDLPLATSGSLSIELEGGEVRVVRIRRIHIEEDAGKNLHGHGGDSIVDLNRAGTPLIEIVSAPDLRSGAEAALYLKALRDVLIFLGVNDGNLEEGSFRCDANVSLRPRGSNSLGIRCEIKNVNSFRFVQKAIEYEVMRQEQILASRGTLRQETRGWNERDGRTFSMRSKEEAEDYRYFPDPDLPPLRIAPEVIEAARTALPELPAPKRERYRRSLGLTPYAAGVLTIHPRIASFFEETLALLGGDASKIANFIQTEVLAGTTLRGLDASFPVAPWQVAELLRLVDDGTISGKQAKEVYAALVGTNASPEHVVKARGLGVLRDEAALEALCRTILDANPKQVAAYRGGKTALLGFFVGAVMKETKGSASPTLVNAILTRLLTGLSRTAGQRHRP
ncbi:MAG: Asp-tRNA(Asn)/Glu-tRNA(Gln) amidotransferase subunit GatB [Myxococcales bacterium]|nr:Asp-tRNA(Asn)/Glu-tRNA(Gln) amidotransferase subunit GatB [Polyangiaceae bacterium]MDW8250694.1 Asp-tRNA(Asn)/Glu-tRNA(Gln) amidotransferase subunit GatB [Myxococcales bacterium]